MAGVNWEELLSGITDKEESGESAAGTPAKPKKSGVDYAALLARLKDGKLTAQDATMAAGMAAGTAVAGPVGAAVGAALGQAVGAAFGGKPSLWKDAGPDVHGWFTNGNKDKGGADWNGGQEVLDWMRANHPQMFGSLDMAKAGRMLYYFQKDRTILHPNDPPQNFPEGSKEGARKFYASIGVDWDRTVERIASSPRGWHGKPDLSEIVMLPGQGTPIAPKPAVTRIIAAGDRLRNGATTKGDRAILDAARPKSGGDLFSSNGIILALVLLVAWAAFKDNG